MFGEFGLYGGTKSRHDESRYADLRELCKQTGWTHVVVAGEVHVVRWCEPDKALASSFAVSESSSE